MRTYLIQFFLPLFLILIGCNKKHDSQSLFVNDVRNPVISLNGTWKISLEPNGTFWDADPGYGAWKDIQVPGECQMQGFAIKHDQPFVYKHKFLIPGDYTGKQIFLYFHGVYSYARVWINGNFLRDHFGGFTKWDCNITEYVTPGDSAIVTVEVTDRWDEISYASGYAKHQIGGILRDVELVALPENHFSDLWLETDLDEDYKDADLYAFYELSKNEKGEVSVELFNEQGQLIQKVEKESVFPEGEIRMKVESPDLWDAEHPNLYKVVVTLKNSGRITMSKTLNVGFREVVVDGNKLLVNGRQVKLRGANRHDVHPMLGRVSTREYELKDVKLAKEANMNFIRTSHYPPTESFLDLCDQYGLYVEDETAICFVGTHRSEQYSPSNTENDESYTHRYLSQIREMVMNHRNHPSVIIWSIGNESSYGRNFQYSYNWLKENDKTRPVIFSYPGLAPDSISTYDILSMHYPDLSGTKEQYGIITNSFSYKDMPVLFDEWIHVSCYNNTTLKEDPNVRDFWGISLDSAWMKLFEADGGLGGAIWGYIDEVFMLPPDLKGFNKWWGIFDTVNVGSEFAGTAIGYGEWGVIDAWRRKKPEFWNVKKAYSPIRILKTEFETPESGQSIILPVINRFDHTNLNEIKAFIAHGDRETPLILPSVEPHSEGEILVDLKEWNPEEPVIIHFKDEKGTIIDSYSVRMSDKKDKKEEDNYYGKVTLLGDNSQAIVKCENDTEFGIDRNTGLFTWFKTPAEKVDFSGPYLNCRLVGKELKYSHNLMDQHATDWELKSLSIEKADNNITIIAKGGYAKLKNVEFITRIFGDGSFTVNYLVDQVPAGIIRELGLKFLFQDVIDSISWKRDPYWSYYPEEHLSAAEAKVSLYPSILNKYRQLPGKSWNLDSKSFFYNGTSDETRKELTYIAKATKENISDFELQTKMESRIKVLPIGTTSCRISKDSGMIDLHINHLLDYPDLAWGNYSRNIPAGGKHSGKIKIIVD